MLLNLPEIANECRIASESDNSETIKRINSLSEQYSADDLMIIYGYFIQHERNISVLMHLVRCLDKIRYAASLDILLNMLLMKGDFKTLSEQNDDYINLRILAVKAIANLKDTRAVVPLLDCLNNKHENYKIRLNCADALGKIGDKYAVVSLMEVVSDEEEKSVYIRESAATALGMLGDMRAVEPLVEILEGKKGLIDKFTFLKERAIEALGKFNFTNDRVFRALRTSLTDESPQIRINAIEALMNSEDERASELIKKMLHDKNEDVVKNAVIALYNLIGSDILFEIVEQDRYSEHCKYEAQNLIAEYETDDGDE